MLTALFLRDITLSFRCGGGSLAGLSFYLLVFALFAFALGPDMLANAAQGVLCVALLLSLIISLPYLFEKDDADGSLEIYLAQAVAPEMLVAAKLAAYWLCHALPLVLLAPFLALMAGMEPAHISVYTLRLFFASLALCATGSFGAALTLRQSRGTLARALILLPLYIPVLIFATSAPQQTLPTILLAAWALFILPLSCYLSGVLVKIAQG